MDSALQAAVGLMDGESTEPRVPFALETLRVLSSCTAEMFAWVRVADAGGKLDIDLCDAEGNVCVQMRGFSTRVLSARVKETGSLLAVPIWGSEQRPPGRERFRRTSRHRVRAAERGSAQ
jgi:polyketide synthase PksN